MKNLTWQNPEQLFVAQELINKVKSKCCGIKVYDKLFLIISLCSRTGVIKIMQLGLFIIYPLVKYIFSQKKQMVNYSIIHLWLTSVQGAGWTIWYALNACECSLIELAKRFFKSYCTMLKIFTKLFPSENFIISLWSSTYLGNEVVLTWAMK